MSDMDSMVDEKQTYREALVGEELRDLVDMMIRYRAEKDNLEEALKAINMRYDILRIEAIPNIMDSMDIERISYEGVGRVALTGDMWVSVIDREKFHGWLGENGLDDLIQPTVNPSTLKAFIKARVKAGEEIPEEILKVTPYTRASITKTQ